MKAKLTVLALIAMVSLFLVGFVNHDQPQSSKQEEYAFLSFYIASNGVFIEKNLNGKTEVVKLEGEKLERSGKSYRTDLIKELEKISEQGYAIINVSQGISPTSSELYLFKKVM